jgi:hypothetical protein
MPMAVETHRSRVLCSPWTIASVPEEVPGVRLSVDLSHWTCVAESIDLRAKVIDALAGTACHIDAQVGHAQDPQVPDPRVESAAPQVARFG